MKAQFQSTESLRIRLTPFVSKITGDYILSGTDTCTLTVEKPDGTLLTGSTVIAAWDSVAKMWIYTITPDLFVIGEWRVYAVSSDTNALPKWLVCFWGDYVDDISTAKNAVSVLGTPAGASLAADVAAVKVDTAAAKIASQAAQSSSGAAASDIAIVKKVQIGRWKINGTQLVLYELDNTTEYKRFDLRDDLGNPSGTRVFERNPQ